MIKKNAPYTARKIKEQQSGNLDYDILRGWEKRIRHLIKTADKPMNPTFTQTIR